MSQTQVSQPDFIQDAQFANESGIAGKKIPAENYALEKILCPLNWESKCMLFENRPIQCRLYGLPDGVIDKDGIEKMLFKLSQNIFFAFSGFFLEDGTLSFSLAETVSGRFVQKYFYYLMALQK